MSLFGAQINDEDQRHDVDDETLPNFIIGVITWSYKPIPKWTRQAYRCTGQVLDEPRVHGNWD
jgi:hypothetical protein